ncbi:SEL1-like repeat protein [Sphingobium fluviale]|uniref:Sel1 repeat family protein n=1 Tax=Sphingobium fluviale TaxID=2506423 RepID=A0A4Q1KDD1_9SPHN|nr:SEL1-like repeat protein [Sphingobium fluviale]RXR25932.1 hypothetical protein EQG66_13615 [Sphingobium fluviale]
MANSIKSAQFLIESRLADAARGDAQACYELGIAYSCGTGGVEIDLIEAHKWLNLAALAGSEEGQALRAEVAEEMTAREIAEAQRLARAWLGATSASRYAA